MARYYITVSIPYVNARPHVGYALELVQADVLARLHREAGDEVRLCGGTDDHALKNALAAQQHGVGVREFVESNAEGFSLLRDPLQISFDDFLRTSSDPRHRPGVERLWRQTANNGDFYRKWYEGHYCVGCEQFYAEADLDEGCCPDHHVRTEWVAEENWFFRLSSYADRLIEVITSDELAIRPLSYRAEVLAFLESGLSDISVSRSRERARGWGIPVPGDPSQVVYVWWDALANYITALDYGTSGEGFDHWWLGADERIHVIGKGILRFHAVYWPALLLSVGLPLPTRLYVHPYLTVNGRKISKSEQNGADPAEIVASYGGDALRWWLVRDVPGNADADFTLERLSACANDDLANGLGNLASRVAAMIVRFRGGVVPGASGGDIAGAKPPAVAALVSALRETVHGHVDNFSFRPAALAINEAVAGLNQYIEAVAPWKLARAEQDEGAQQVVLGEVLGFLARAVTEVALAAHPLIPAGAERVGLRLGPPGAVLDGGLGPAFPRLEV